MKVYLAGYNVDTAILREMEEKTGPRQDLTPEVISAAYARISRDPRPINEIRKDAREEVERSRRSNSTIIFKMGHHSVAEHAVFNLDVLGVSRLAMEEIEKFRLCSYTEKSQRYITLDKDFVLPEEIKGTNLEKIFRETIQLQNKAYFEFFKKLKDYVFSENKELAADPKKHNLLEGWAKEDARYVTALATESQLGLTINARNLELMLRRFSSHPLAEIKNLGKAIYEKVVEIAPSIIIFHQASSKDIKTYPELKKFVAALLEEVNSEILAQDVRLIEFTNDADAAIAASLLHTSSNQPYEQCKTLIKNLSLRELEELFKTAWQNTQFYDSMLREFEYANLTFDITLSAACFGQLKRHRMSTITTQPYNLRLGVTMPETIKTAGLEKSFQEVIAKTNEAYEAIYKQNPLAAPYILTNAHKKRVLMRFNARELYHISRLREDTHAQWDIQNISKAMIREAKKVMPITFMLTAGKDKYNEIYQNLYGKAPEITEAALPGARKIK
ncbi:MAG: FAD-dependent thymidylate synthase [Candidatus Omnitrophota bacterium]